MAKIKRKQLRRKRSTRHKYLRRRQKAATYELEDYVLLHRIHFPGKITEENENRLDCGPYLVTGVTDTSITAGCSSTLDGEVNVAHKYLKKLPFPLIVNPDSDTEGGDCEAEVLVNEAEDIPDLQDDAEKSLPEYSEKEVARARAVLR